MTKETGGFAFPHTGNNAEGTKPELGMTLRDWFAGMALQGALAKYGFGDLGKHGSEMCISSCASNAYELADAMLAEMSK